MFETDIDRGPKAGPGPLPNLSHLRNRYRSNSNWIWVDATVANAELHIGAGKIDTAGIWLVSYNYIVGSHQCKGQFWQSANSYSELKPYARGDVLPICANPEHPDQHYCLAAADSAKFRVWALAAGAILGLVAVGLEILNRHSK